MPMQQEQVQMAPSYQQRLAQQLQSPAQGSTASSVMGGFSSGLQNGAQIMQLMKMMNGAQGGPIDYSMAGGNGLSLGGGQGISIPSFGGGGE